MNECGKVVNTDDTWEELSLKARVCIYYNISRKLAKSWKWEVFKKPEIFLDKPKKGNSWLVLKSFKPTLPIKPKKFNTDRLSFLYWIDVISFLWNWQNSGTSEQVFCCIEFPYPWNAWLLYCINYQLSGSPLFLTSNQVCSIQPYVKWKHDIFTLNTVHWYTCWIVLEIRFWALFFDLLAQNRNSSSSVVIHVINDTKLSWCITSEY